MDYKQGKNILALKSSVPEGQEGIWKVERFTIDIKGANFHNLIERIHFSNRNVEPGFYTKLTRDNNLVMSDTPSEKYDVMNFFYNARGDILINGLGLGWTVEACFHIPEVSHITVVEMAPEVIRLVGNYLRNKYGENKLKIYCDDALLFSSPKNKIYDAVWHDIWDNICADNWESMKKLHRKYGKKSRWQGSWCRERIKELNYRELSYY